MRVTVIGCWGGSPRAGGACSGYLVEHEGSRLLLDCGAGVASRLRLACPLEDVHHVFVSHYHYDHVSDAGALMYARLVARQVEALRAEGDPRLAAAGMPMRPGVPTRLDDSACPSTPASPGAPVRPDGSTCPDTSTYPSESAGPGTSTRAGESAFPGAPGRPAAATLPELTFYAQPGDAAHPGDAADFARLTMPGVSHAYAVAAGDRRQIGPFGLAFLRTRHPVPCLAARVETPDGAVLAYTADGALTPELAPFCAGADALLAECSLYPGFDGASSGHMSCDDVAELALAARPRALVLTHLPVYGDPRVLLGRVRERLAGRLACDVLLACDPPTGQGLLSFNVFSRLDETRPSHD